MSCLLMKFAVIAHRRSHLHSRVKSILAITSHQRFSFIIAAAVVLALAGCGGVSANSPSPTPSSTPPTATPTPVTTPTPAPSTVNVPTWHMNNARTGLNDQETLLTPANVSGGSFGKLFSYAVDGYVYAQPLYISNLNINGRTHNVVFVATEMATVYAFDADNFGDGSPQSGGNPKPFQGLTSTPVIDTSANTMYLVSSQKSTGAPFFRLHAIDITTGQERAGSPVVIHASVPGTNSESVNGVINLTVACLQRASLLLSQGTLFIGFSA